MSLIQQLEAYQRIQNRITQLQQVGKHQEAQHLSNALQQIANQKRETFEAELPTQSAELAEMTQLLRDTIKELKILTEIKATASISYDKIKIDWVKKRLVSDNLRMENVLYNINISDTERFHSFCSNAFFQIENLLNYYYYSKYTNFSDCISYFKSKGTKFDDNRDPHKLSHIQSYSKLYCFESEFYYDPKGITFYDSQLDMIRQIRNLESHRCDVYRQDYEKHREAFLSLKEKIAGFKKNGLTYTKEKKDQRVEKDGKLADFIKNQNFELVRDEIIILYGKVMSNL
jgi:hypothetical protein